MRTAAELRALFIDRLRSMLLRPRMFGEDQPFAMAVSLTIGDLAFIDQRDDEWDAVAERLRETRMFRKTGVCGAFGAAYRSNEAFTHEIASIYARVASELGYFAPERRLSEAEWTLACEEAPTWVSAATTPDDVEQRLGPPSYRAQGQGPCVFAYAGADDAAWLYFDFVHCGPGWLPRRLRGLRPPAAEFRVLRVDDNAPFGEGSPEHAYRQFLLANLRGIESEIRPLVIESPGMEVLWQGAYPDDVAAPLREQYESMDLVPLRRSDTPWGECIVLQSSASTEPTTLYRLDGVWKVDARPIIAFRLAKK